MITEEVVRFAGMPPEHERLIWCEWLERHSIDPHRVAVPGFICRDVDNYRVVYETYERDENGEVVVTIEDGMPVCYVVSTFTQLEGPPLPFPRFPVSAALGYAWRDEP